MTGLGAATLDASLIACADEKKKPPPNSSPSSIASSSGTTSPTWNPPRKRNKSSAIIYLTGDETWRYAAAVYDIYNTARRRCSRTILVVRFVAIAPTPKKEEKNTRHVATLHRSLLRLTCDTSIECYTLLLFFLLRLT